MDLFVRFLVTSSRTDQASVVFFVLFCFVSSLSLALLAAEGEHTVVMVLAYTRVCVRPPDRRRSRSGQEEEKNVAGNVVSILRRICTKFYVIGYAIGYAKMSPEMSPPFCVEFVPSST